MGLDMYAYTIDASLLTDDDQVDVPITDIALKSIGFDIKTDDELKTLHLIGGLQDYYEKRDNALAMLKATGVLNQDFAYWRKFNHLHGWMEDLYRDKGGESHPFNCNNVRLELADLNRLESDADSGVIAPRDGMFFGSTDPFSEEDANTIRQFVRQASQAIKAGKAVFYDSWW